MPDFFYEKFILQFWCKELKINTFATLIKILNMKKIVLLLGLVSALVACEKTLKNEYLITGTANGIENGKKIFIEIEGENGFLGKDTAVVENGKFEFNGEVSSMEIAFLRIENEDSSLPFILEEGKLKITYAIDTIFNSKLSGTYNNDVLQSFNEKSADISKRLAKFQKFNSDRIIAAKKANDTTTVNMIMKEYNSYQEELNIVSKNFISENPKAYLSIILVENFLMRGYIPTEETTNYFNKLDKSILETKRGQKLSELIKVTNTVKIGKKAPNFSAPSPEGKPISLNESLGKVTIIDFWASWCGPCRQENPNVVAMYNELHEKGLNIIGVSLDRDGDKWKEAIAKDGLTWPQISNLKFWQEPIAEQYNVKSIPATFILDENGIIVARDLRGDELKAKVKEILGL